MVVQGHFSRSLFLADDHRLLLSKDFSPRRNDADVRQGITGIFKPLLLGPVYNFPLCKLSTCKMASIFMALSVITRLDVLIRV